MLNQGGFLLGPICPIYGYGGLIMLLYLNKYQSDPVLLFVSSIVFFAILEYFTSYSMEKIFKARWWDYSNDKLNLNGRITLKTLPIFGALGLVVTYFINPILTIFFNKINNTLLIGIAIFLFILFVIDNIISFLVVLKFKNTATTIKDNTEEITEYVKKVLSKFFLTRRVIKAFPNFKITWKNKKK